MRILLPIVLAALAALVYSKWTVLQNEYQHDSQNISIMLSHRF